MTTEIRKPILLTGAGFTRNFGGFLADQMWVRIFNRERIQSRPTLLTFLKDNFDFEAVYNQVMRNECYTQEDRAASHEAVESAYKQLDDVTRHYWGSPHPYGPRPLVSPVGLNNFLEHFASGGKSRGYIFTLNQDLFVERWFTGGREHKLLTTPGIKPLAWNPRERPLALDDYIQVPSSPTEVHEISSNLLYYIKLHGSMNWKSSDGQGLMVIGGDKRAQIEREPLLQQYLKIFADALSRPNRRLLVIGYGFRDLHINEIIANSIRQHGLKLCVISPVRPKDFREMLHREDNEDKHTQEDKQTLWEGLTGYWDWELKDVCPASQNYFSEEIRRAIFQS